MPRPSVTDRARLYLQEMPAAVSGAGGHDQTFSVACVLVKGFDLSIDEARPLLAEYNQRCMPPWNERDLEHKLLSADKSADDRSRGYLAGDDAGGNAEKLKSGNADSAAGTPRGARGDACAPQKPVFDAEKLRKFAGEWAEKVNLLWLGERSVHDPAEVTSGGFLEVLFPGERVLVFTDQMSQGEALWPEQALPVQGRDGVWFLCQPVDGEYHPNPRQGKMSRRSRESVTSWRYLVLESDEAPAKLWLGALVQLPLRIAAIYSSGGRSVHALVRLDARTEREWGEMRERLLPGIVALGADRQSMSSVRLTRLPGCFRASKGSWQKLLYLNPNPPAEPMAELMKRRDVGAKWWEAASGLGAKGWPKGEALSVLSGCRFYERFDGNLRQAAAELEDVLKLMESNAPC